MANKLRVRKTVQLAQILPSKPRNCCSKQGRNSFIHCCFLFQTKRSVVSKSDINGGDKQTNRQTKNLGGRSAHTQREKTNPNQLIQVTTLNAMFQTAKRNIYIPANARNYKTPTSPWNSQLK